MQSIFPIILQSWQDNASNSYSGQTYFESDVEPDILIVSI